MAYPVTNPLIHEILGIVTLICFVVHHLLNRKWYQTLMKGKLSLIKKVYIFINFILLIDILVIFLSGLTMSKILPFFNFMAIGMARKAHMMATYWGFILMAIHLGLHLQIMLVKIKKYISKQSHVVASIISFVSVYDTFIKMIKNFGIELTITWHIILAVSFMIVCFIVPTVINFRFHIKKIKKTSKEMKYLEQQICNSRKMDLF